VISSHETEWSGEGAFFGWAGVTIYGLMVVLSIGWSATSIIAALFNPEYWALMQVLNHIR
jgi:hypothetical protein